MIPNDNYKLISGESGKEKHASSAGIVMDNGQRPSHPFRAQDEHDAILPFLLGAVD